MIAVLIAGVASLLLSSCTPLKSSPKEEKHQMELTLHELRTGIDDLTHDYNCYQTELQILDNKINKQDDSISKIKQQELPLQEDKIRQSESEIVSLKRKISELEKKIQNCTENIHRLSSYANETSLAFSQYKDRIDTLEKGQNEKLDEIIKLRSTIQSLAHLLHSFSVYKVKKGDSLEKIAKDFQTNVDEIKRMNHLDNDLIVIGQELKIPSNR